MFTLILSKMDLVSSTVFELCESRNTLISLIFLWQSHQTFSLQPDRFFHQSPVNGMWYKWLYQMLLLCLLLCWELCFSSGTQLLSIFKWGTKSQHYFHCINLTNYFSWIQAGLVPSGSREEVVIMSFVISNLVTELFLKITMNVKPDLRLALWSVEG